MLTAAVEAAKPSLAIDGNNNNRSLSAYFALVGALIFNVRAQHKLIAKRQERRAHLKAKRIS